MSELNDTQRQQLQLQPVLGSSEVLVFQDVMQFAVFDAGTIQPTLSGLAQRTGGGATATFRLRVGGTVDAVDGSVVATVTTPGALAAVSNTGSNIAKPVSATGTLIKVTAQGDDPTAISWLKRAVIQFKGV